PEEVRLDTIRPDQLFGQAADPLLARTQGLVACGDRSPRAAELALERAVELLHRLARARGRERLPDDVRDQRERGPAAEEMHRRDERVEDQRAAGLAADQERQDEEPLAGEIGRGDRHEAAVGHAAEALRLDAGPDELREEQPPALADPVRAAAEPLRLGREPDQPEL